MKIRKRGEDMDKNINFGINVDGLASASQKAAELNAELEKAKSLAGDLASLLQNLSIEIDIKS